MKPLTFHNEAEAEVRSAIAYYEGQRRGLGKEFRLELETALGQIQLYPKAFSPYDDRGTRKRLLRRFPYTIYYVEFDDFNWVAAVAHQRRRPGYWANRTLEDG